jgi:uncharacterized membrane protein YhaH (DUF805 family)/uncharacterized membrane protein YphA (DoxX/SURF4 family)
MKTLILIVRVVFGVWMAANGLNHFLGHPLYPEPVGHEPLAIQLLTAFQHSRLFDVAMAMELVAGVLILAGVIIPVALCVITPVNVCAVYWALVLDHQPLTSLLAIAALALNGVLMLVYFDYYKDMLQRNVLSLGETAGSPSWNQTYAWSTGRTSRMDYLKALIPLILAAAFYTFLAKTGRNGEWVLATLLYPGFVLVAGRLHDMGLTAWVLAAPALLDAIALWLHFFPSGAGAIGANVTLGVVAYAVSISFLLWGAVGKGTAAANRFGEPAAA